jgi:hypothetical protein
VPLSHRILTGLLALAACAGCAAAPRADQSATPSAGPTQPWLATPVASSKPSPTAPGAAVVPSPPPTPSALDWGYDAALDTVVEPGPRETPEPTLTPPPTPTPVAQLKPFSIDLYHKGDFASQATTYYCVPASIEVMMNMIDGGPPDTSRSTQDDLYRLLRADLIQPYWGKGGQPEGWAQVLNTEGDGPYRLAIRASSMPALRVAATQLRLTGKPVGLLVWRGYHAWVMSGFTSIGDPARTNAFTLTGVYVEDPWYPRISSTYGASRRPDSFYSLSALARFFLPYDQHGEGGLDKDGKFVVVIPQAGG